MIDIIVKQADNKVEKIKNTLKNAAIVVKKKAKIDINA